MSLGVPLGFLAVNAFLKWLLGVLNANLLGADMSMSGCTLFVGTLLAGIYHGRVTANTDIVVAIILALAFILVWGLCLSLGTSAVPIGKGSKHQPRVALALGFAALYQSVTLTWGIIQGLPK